MGSGLANVPLGFLSQGEISYKHFVLTVKTLEMELLESFDERLPQMY